MKSGPISLVGAALIVLEENRTGCSVHLGYATSRINSSSSGKDLPGGNPESRRITFRLRTVVESGSWQLVGHHNVWPMACGRYWLMMDTMASPNLPACKETSRAGLVRRLSVRGDFRISSPFPCFSASYFLLYGANEPSSNQDAGVERGPRLKLTCVH